MLHMINALYSWVSNMESRAVQFKIRPVIGSVTGTMHMVAVDDEIFDPIYDVKWE